MNFVGQRKSAWTLDICQAKQNSSNVLDLNSGDIQSYFFTNVARQLPFFLFDWALVAKLLTISHICHRGLSFIFRSIFQFAVPNWVQVTNSDTRKFNARLLYLDTWSRIKLCTNISHINIYRQCYQKKNYLNFSPRKVCKKNWFYNLTLTTLYYSEVSGWHTPSQSSFITLQGLW